MIFRNAPEPPVSQPVPPAAVVQSQISTDQHALQQRQWQTNHSMIKSAVQLPAPQQRQQQTNHSITKPAVQSSAP